MPLGEEIPLEREHKRGNRYFTIAYIYSVKTVADRQRLTAYDHKRTADELSSGTNIDDLERP